MNYLSALLVSWNASTITIVEKTPENCLRVPYLLDLFPDARFVFAGA